MGMIYAIHNVTKRHFLVDEGARNWDGPVGEYHFAEADADGWIAWEGGECPLPENRGFNAITRDGGVHEECNVWRWNHAGLSSDIIAYSPVLDEPGEREAAEWDGEGDPPVGVVCEARNYHNRSAFEKAMVVHRTRKGVTLVEYEDGDAGFLTAPADFRPIRSEEDRAVEAMLALDDYDTESYNSGMMSRDDFCRALYRAGYRKQEVE